MVTAWVTTPFTAEGVGDANPVTGIAVDAPWGKLCVGLGFVEGLLHAAKTRTARQVIPMHAAFPNICCVLIYSISPNLYCI